MSRLPDEDLAEMILKMDSLEKAEDGAGPGWVPNGLPTGCTRAAVLVDLKLWDEWVLLAKAILGSHVCACGKAFKTRGGLKTHVRKSDQLLLCAVPEDEFSNQER